jgi:2-iminobutanoate/2-iminopropanoate deaminase
MTERESLGGIAVGGDEPLISSAVRWGDLLFLSGRAPVDTRTMKVVSDDFEDQARFVLRDVVQALREAGSGPEHVLKVVCYVLDPTDFSTWNRLWAETLPAPRPARTTIVSGFTVPGMLIEVVVTAFMDGRSG